MSGLLEYSGLATKLKAMGACLLAGDDYEYLMNMTSQEEVIEYLKRHDSYRTVFGKEASESLSRIRIEQLLQDTVYLDYRKVYSFSSMNQKAFLKTYFIKYEIAVIKLCLGICLGHHPEGMSPYSYTSLFAENMSIDVSALMNSSDIDELISNLVGTDYYKVLGVLKINSNATLYDYEVLLDIYYYKTLWRSLHKKLSGDELRMMHRLYGTEIDMLNMQWIYRAKKYYRLTEADIYALLIPVRYRLKKDDIIAMVKAGNMSELERLLLESGYGRYMDTESEDWLERASSETKGRLQRRNIRSNPYSVACIDYYFYRKELETEKLVKIIECLRYGKGADEMRKIVNH